METSLGPRILTIWCCCCLNTRLQLLCNKERKQRIPQWFLKVSSHILWSKQVTWPCVTSRRSVLEGEETWKSSTRDVYLSDHQILKLSRLPLRLDSHTLQKTCKDEEVLGKEGQQGEQRGPKKSHKSKTTRTRKRTCQVPSPHWVILTCTISFNPHSDFEG